MSDDRRIFVEVVVDEAAALARLANVDRGVVQIGKSAAQAKADFHALFDGSKITPAVDATKAAAAAQKQHEAAIKAVTERYAESNKRLIEHTNLVRTIGRDFYQAGQFLTLALTVPLVAASVASLKFAMDFETSMTRLQTLSMVTAENMGVMRDAVLALAPTVGIGPNKLAEALLQVTSTGIRGTEAMEVLEVAAKGSAVGLGDVTTVAKTLTSVLAAYGAENITAAEAGNVLYKMVVEGKGELTEFAGALGRVVGMAAMVGVSMADAGAFIATFTRTGGSAAEAVTALRNVLQRLEISSKSTTEAALKTLGLSLAELREQIATKGLTPTLVDLIHTFGATNDVLGKLFPNVRGLAGVMTVAGAQAQSADEIYRHLSDGLKDELSPAFELTAETMQFRWNQIKAHFEAAAIALGEQLFPQLERIIPVMERMITTLVGLIDRFGQLSPWVQTATLTVFALAAAIGPLLIVLGGMARVVGVVLDALIFLNVRAEKAAVAQLELAAASRTAASSLATVAPAANAAAVGVGATGTAARVAAGTFLGLTGPAWAVVGAIGTLAYGIKTLAGDWTRALYIMAPPLGALKDSWDRTGSLVLDDILSVVQSAAILKWRELRAEVDEVGRKIKFIIDLIPGMDKIGFGGATGVDARGLRGLADGLREAIRLQDEANKPIHYGIFAPQTDEQIRRTSQSMWDNADASAALGKAHLEGAHATDVLTGAGLANAEQAAASKDAFASLRDMSAKYHDEVKALSATSRRDLVSALQEGVLSLGVISKTTGVSMDALQLLQRELKNSATAAKDMESGLSRLSAAMRKTADENLKLAPSFTTIQGLLVNVVKSAGEAGTQFGFLGWAIEGVRNTLPSFMGLMPVITSNITSTMNEATEQMVNGLSNIIRNLGATFRRAFTSGGGALGALKAIGAQMAEAMAASFLERLASEVSRGLMAALTSKTLVSAATSAGSSAGAGVSLASIGKVGLSALGPVVALTGIFAGFMSMRAASARHDAIEAENARLRNEQLAELARRLAEVPPLYEELYQKVKATGLAHASELWEMEQQIPVLEEILSLEEEQEAVVGRINDAQAELARLEAQLIPSWQDVNAAAEKYGLSIDGAGQKVQQLKTTADMTAFINDWEMLQRAGWDTSNMLEGMSDELNAMVWDARKYGTELPAQMKPILEAMLSQGLLTDEAGRKLTDLSGLKFGAPVETEADKIRLAMDAVRQTILDLQQTLVDLVDKIAALVNPSEETAREVRKHWERAPWADWTDPVWPSEPGPRDGGGRGAEGGRMHNGGLVGGLLAWAEAPRAHQGLAADEVPIIAQRGERVLSRDDTGRLERLGGLAALRRLPAGSGGGQTVVQAPITVVAWDASSVDVWMHRGGARQLARAVTPATIDELTSRGLVQRRRV